MTTEARNALHESIEEARDFWHAYLWHHRHPRTRLLHRVGSWVCILGFAMTASGYGWLWTPAAIAVGYGFAFAGHWFVERNRPMTFSNPVRAAIGNWTMFVYEMFWDVEIALALLALNPPSTEDVGDQ